MKRFQEQIGRGTGSTACLILVLLLGFCLDAQAQNAEPLRPGGPVPPAAEPLAVLLPPVRSTALCGRAYAVTHGGTPYWFTTTSNEDHAVICGIYVWDPGFATPEGVRAGWPRAALSIFGPARPSLTGAYDLIALPSQWYAALPRLSRVPGDDAAPRRMDRRLAVAFLFREQPSEH